MMTLPRDPKAFRPGAYKHTKSGNLYVADKLVRHHETGDLLVLYLSFDHAAESGETPYSVREWADGKADSWTDLVRIADGTFKPRFVPVDKHGDEVLPTPKGCLDSNHGLVILYRIDDVLRNTGRIHQLVARDKPREDLFLDDTARAHVRACNACHDLLDDAWELLGTDHAHLPPEEDEQ
jgi:hypothetical protein